MLQVGFRGLGTIIHFFKGFLRQEDGVVLPIMALTFPVLMAIIGLGTDASLWMANKRVLQTAADSAAMAAVWEIAMDSDDLTQEAALKEAIANGYDPDRNGVFELTVVSATSAGTTLGVSLTQDANSFFSQIIMPDSARVEAYAEAFVSANPSSFCLLSLNEEDSGTFTTSGSVEVDVPACGLAVNSSADDAMSINGNVDLTFGDVSIVGDYEVIGGSADFSYDTLATGTAAAVDPYADMELPDDGDECGGGGGGTRVNSDTTLSPGTYCGGLTITGNNDVVFEPGVYYIDGGDFDVSGGGSLYGEGITFVLTGSGSDYANLDITGGRSIEFSAPAEGEETAGIVFFQDRDAPYLGSNANNNNKLTGTSDIVLNGSAYFPTRDISFGGNSDMDSLDSPCTRVIAQRITLHGNPAMGNACENVAVDDDVTPQVYLVN